DAAVRQQFAQGPHDLVAVTFGTGTQQLAHQHVVVAVDGQTGQAVVLGCHQAAGIAGQPQVGAGLQCGFDAAQKEGIVDDLVLQEGPDAHADSGGRRPGATAEPLPVCCHDVDAVADVQL